MEREKKLLILLGIIGFGVANVFLHDWYSTKRKKVESSLTKVRSEVEVARASLSMFEESSEMSSEMDWLERFGPKPGEHREVQDRLMEDVQKYASQMGVTIKGAPTQIDLKDEVVGDYAVAKVEFKVNTSETGFYNWLVRFQQPQESRGISQLVVNPQRDDNTRVDCTVVFQEWFQLQEEGLEQ